jgi:hypothetical protein
MVKLRVNRNRSPHEPDSLIHACQPHASSSFRRFDLEASTPISDFEMNLIRLLPQLYFDLFNSTVLDCIVKTFLQDSEQRQPDL